MDTTTNYATIPIRRHTGELLGVIKRAMKNQRPKYIYPSGFNKARELFGSWLVKGRFAVLVEGALDAIACREAGYTGLAVYGSHLSVYQVLLLKKLGISEVTVLMDADITGRKATSQAIEALGNQFLVYKGRLRKGDPFDTPRNTLREVIEKSRPV